MQGDFKQFIEELQQNTLQADVPLNKYGWTPLHTASYFGHLNMVQYLIFDMNVNPNKKNNNGWHSLFFAVNGGHIDVIDFLLFETDVDTAQTDKNNKTAYDVALEQNDKEILNLFEEKEDTRVSISSIDVEEY